MAKKRNTHSSTFKAKVALESVKGLQSASQIASHHSVHVSQLHQWKRHLLENASTLFESGKSKASQEQAADQQLIEQLYQHVGKLQMELEFLKKKAALFE
jgi:transposase-like protein